MQAAEEAERAADLLQKAEAALEDVTKAEAAAAETGYSRLIYIHVMCNSQKVVDNSGVHSGRYWSDSD